MPFGFFSLPSTCSAVVLLLAFSQSTLCHPRSSLWSRATPKTIPAPIAFPPAQNWEGIDGAWNTFVLRVGTPEQTVRVIISTASQQIWVVDPRGCNADDNTTTNCPDARGTTFNLETSTTWKPQGLYDLWIEQNLGLQGNAEYGFDTVGLGYPGESGVTLKDQTVGALATTQFYFGHFGINPKPTNFTNYTSQSPSFMTTLKEQSLIPSVSWGYTAGAIYRFTKILSSLTLGGYDSSRFIANNITFPFAADNERDVLVSIQSITSKDSQNKQTSLLPKPIYSYIDSTVAEIWLPVESCVLFEKAFGLVWDPNSELYLVSDALHNQLLITNPNITLNVAPWTQPGKSDSVDIVLPYKAFDLTAKPPYQTLNKTSRYFPLRRAENDQEYTLGRTFLQEAYLIVDWERQNFSVSQVSWVASAQQHLVPILSINATNTTGAGAANSATQSKASLTPGAIAGIAVGVVAILLLSGILALMYLRRKRDRAIKLEDEDTPTKTVDTESSKGEEEGSTTLVFPKAELEANTPVRHEADGTFYKPGTSEASVFESDSKEREIFEMPGDMPRMQEADGRQMSEKEAMRVREERYNGVDPATATPTVSNVGSDRSPISPNDRSPSSTYTSGTLPSTLNSGAARRQMVAAGDVIELTPVENRTLLPVSPLDGSDGSRTLLFSPLSPIGPGSDNSPDATRRRFSYEE